MLYNIYTADDQLMAVAALVSSDGFWAAGSACGPVTGRTEPFEVGSRFDHFVYGSVEVAKVNRRTAKLFLLDASGRVAETVTIDIRGI